MKFEITRTSLNGRPPESDFKPCVEATLGSKSVVDERVFKSFEEFDEQNLNYPWLSYGTNHKVTQTGISRDLGIEPVWFINVDSLEDLLALSTKYGPLILNKGTLEIYDSYRE